jgi:hypothetical protein
VFVCGLLLVLFCFVLSLSHRRPQKRTATEKHRRTQTGRQHIPNRHIKRAGVAPPFACTTRRFCVFLCSSVASYLCCFVSKPQETTEENRHRKTQENTDRTTTHSKQTHKKGGGPTLRMYNQKILCLSVFVCGLLLVLFCFVLSLSHRRPQKRTATEKHRRTQTGRQHIPNRHIKGAGVGSALRMYNQKILCFSVFVCGLLLVLFCL